MPIRKLPEVKCSWVSFFRRPGCGSKCGIWGHIHGVLCPNHPEPLHPTHSSPQAYLPFPPLHLALLLFIHQSSDSSSTIRLNNLKVNGCHGPQGPLPKKKHSPGEETERWSLFFADARRDVTPPPGRMPRKLCLSVCLSKKLRVVYRLMFFPSFNVFRSIL